LRDYKRERERVVSFVGVGRRGLLEREREKKNEKRYEK
jgi:hypothetical protein